MPFFTFHSSLFTLHSTPLAPSLPSQGSWRGPGVGGEAFPCTLSFVLKNALKCIFFQKSLEVQKLSVTLQRFKCVFHSNRFLGLLTRESRQSFLYMKIKMLHRPESLIIEGRFFKQCRERAFPNFSISWIKWQKLCPCRRIFLNLHGFSSTSLRSARIGCENASHT